MMMSGWDYYCAICGGPFSIPGWNVDGFDPGAGRDNDDFESHGYDPNIVNQDDSQMDWIEDFRVIMSSPNEYNTRHK